MFTGKYGIFVNNFGDSYLKASFCGANTNKIFVPACLNDGFLNQDFLDCPEGYGCTKTNILVNGETIKTAKCVLPNSDLESCADSDGEDIFTVGLTTGVNKFGLDFRYKDYCDSKTAVLESSCNSNTLERKIIDCPENHICVNEVFNVFNNEFVDGSKCVLDEGEPIITQCTDSDLDDESLAGFVWLTTNYGQIVDAQRDFCLNETEVNESYCDGVNISQKIITCPENYKCGTQEFFISELGISEVASMCILEN